MGSTTKLIQAAAGAGVESAGLDYFQTSLYTGNQTSQTITNDIDLAGEGGLVWIKNRDAVDSHALFDTVRGQNRILESDTTSAEVVNNQTLNSFNSDGFSIGDASQVNALNEDFVAWTFRKAPKFFDVVKYTGNGSGSGQSISHSLTTSPRLVLVKRIGASDEWRVQTPLGNWNNSYMELNTNNGNILQADMWRTSSGRSSSFFFVLDSTLNASGVEYIAYVFAHNTGPDGETIIYTGTYTGNGTSQDIDCNFSTPARFVMVKRHDSAGNWLMFDAERGMDTASDPILNANLNNAEAGGSDRIEQFSSGFTVKGINDPNISGAGYLFLAIA